MRLGQRVKSVVALAGTDHQLEYKGQTDRAGLGSVKGRYSANDSAKEHRARCAKAVADQDQDVAYQHTVSLAWQSVWSNWADDVIPFDLSWRNLLYGPGPKLIAFILNATINWAQTPDLLLLWGKSKVSKCALCGASPCSLHHILVICSVALNGKRYTWRHDSVLNTIQSSPHVQPVPADASTCHFLQLRSCRSRSEA